MYITLPTFWSFCNFDIWTNFKFLLLTAKLLNLYWSTASFLKHFELVIPIACAIWPYISPKLSNSPPKSNVGFIVKQRTKCVHFFTSLEYHKKGYMNTKLYAAIYQAGGVILSFVHRNVTACLWRDKWPIFAGIGNRFLIAYWYSVRPCVGIVIVW